MDEIPEHSIQLVENHSDEERQCSEVEQFEAARSIETYLWILQQHIEEAQSHIEAVRIYKELVRQQLRKVTSTQPKSN